MLVAVAVTARPGLIAMGTVAVNEALPVASVITVVLPRKICPWAWLPGPGRGLSKNSRVNALVRSAVERAGDRVTADGGQNGEVLEVVRAGRRARGMVGRGAVVAQVDPQGGVGVDRVPEDLVADRLRRGQVVKSSGSLYPSLIDFVSIS